MVTLLNIIKYNYYTGVTTLIDHDNKTIYINLSESYIKNTAIEYAKYGAGIGIFISGIYGAFINSLFSAAAGIFIGLYREKKEQKKINQLERSGYKIQYMKQVK